jgi:uncharacterized membrane protein YfcA
VLLLVVLLGVGVVTGMLAGLLGVGGGVLMVPFLVLVVGMTQHEAEATSLLVVLPTAIVASLTLRSRGVGDLRTSLAFGAIGAAAGVAGALLALALPASALRTVFAVFLALVGGKLLRDGLIRPRAH